ncbi:phage gp6-like head-tail connector protein [Alkalicoccobacillus gibsonii]|uniref:phage gp6-like head-tail connector protein n=1 Tax=Alkalicoccobacillus gibsonii TaxID=79881 RepID=UPI001AED874F|nr:phage gp6-like head-tail connector protein [Alkalicoccobacillus gibsonii]
MTDEVLEQFKSYMKITHGSEDNSLKRLLFSSYLRIKDLCGDFSLDEEGIGKDLVFGRARYMYNDALEYFEPNFLTLINGFALSNLPDEVIKDEEV